MSETRSVFKTGVSSVIYSNTGKLIKGNTVRDKFLVMADSVLFINTDANVAGGYLGIDPTNANVDVSFIKSTSPSPGGMFLKDDGTWSVVNCLPSQGSNNGKFLTTNGSTASWVSISVVPGQDAATVGKFLISNGSVASWESVSQVPSQSGAEGKFLTSTSGSASWATVSQLPSQSGANGKFLTSNGTTASWASVSATPGGSDTHIQYNKSSGFDATNRFVWDYTNAYFKVDGSSVFGLETSNSPTAFVDIAPAISSKASLRIRSSGGTAPSSPNDGDIWYNGTFLFMRIGGANKKFTIT